MLSPTLPGRSEAPTTAIELGEKIGSQPLISDLLLKNLLRTHQVVQRFISLAGDAVKLAFR